MAVEPFRRFAVTLASIVVAVEPAVALVIGVLVMDSVVLLVPLVSLCRSLYKGGFLLMMRKE